MLTAMVTIKTSTDSMCSMSSGSLGPYSNSHWCTIVEEVGSLRLYGRASRSCAPGHVNTTYLQLETYQDTSCNGNVVEVETIRIDECLPLMSGSIKMTIDTSSMSGNIRYTTFSDNMCVIQSGSMTMFAYTKGGAAATCTMISGSAKGMRLYIVTSVSSPPTGAVVETVYPSIATSTNCTTSDADPIMIRYTRPNECLASGSPGQYGKMSCGSDPGTYDNIAVMHTLYFGHSYWL